MKKQCLQLANDFRIYNIKCCLDAPAMLKCLIDKILRGLLWDLCMCYLGDSIVYGDSFFKALANLVFVFQCIRTSGLRLKPSKCELFMQELLYLGFLINAEGVRSAPSLTFVHFLDFAIIIVNLFAIMRLSPHRWWN